MLAFFKKSKEPYRDPAYAIYEAILRHIRQKAFFEICAVPDTFTGRFDLLTLHVFMVMETVLQEGKSARNKSFNQALFDRVFADMDQTLRERGIGDMGVPKHMRRMMKAFNGRLLAYAAGLAPGGDLKAALRRNLYGTLHSMEPSVDDGALSRMEHYVRDTIRNLKAAPPDDLLNGLIMFQAVKI